MAEEDTHPALQDYPIDRAYGSQGRPVDDTSSDESVCSDGSQARRVPSYDDLSVDEYLPTPFGSNGSQGISEPLESFGEGWHGGHTKYDHTIDQGPIEHDGRAKTRTGFDPRDAADPKRYRRLLPWQEGRWHEDHHQAKRDADNRRWMKLCTSQLSMTTYQRDRSLAIMKSIDMSHMSHYRTETIILAIISLVANEDDRWIRDEEGFRKLLSNIDASLRDVRRCRALIRDKSDIA